VAALAPVAAAVTGLTVLVPAGQARAAASPGCLISGGQVTCTFLYSSGGAAQSWQVPPGVTSAAFTLFGAEGGTGVPGGYTDGPGGLGAEVTATLTVSPGTVLQVNDGQAGSFGGTNGIGGGGAAGEGAGSGGGASDIRSPAADGSYPLASRLLVAGGGGGGGQADSLTDPAAAGGNADNPGSGGASIAVDGVTLGGAAGGAAGTIAGGGIGGAGGTLTGSTSCPGGAFAGPQGADGGLGTGGDDTLNFNSGGGGGGGGYYGGGGGGGYAFDRCPNNSGGGGGGGGASYTGGGSGATITDGVAAPDDAPNGEVIVSYTDPITTGSPAYTATTGTALSVGTGKGLLSAAAGTSGPPGDLTAEGPASTAAGGSLAINANGSFTYTPPAGFAGTDSFGYTVSDGFDYATGTATIAVNQAPAFVTDSPPLAAFTGEPYSYDFTASGTPAPRYGLAAGAPPWLSVNASTGQVSGTPPKGTTAFSYQVTAANAVGTATAGPYAVTVTTFPPPEADLAAVLQCTAHLRVGAVGKCTMAIDNFGPDAAAGASESVSLPAGLAEVSCTRSCARDGNVVIWAKAYIPYGDVVDFIVHVQAITAGQMQVAGSVTARTRDPQPGDNFAAATIVTH
jgi:Big-like domain-containing protein/uncharacterized protein DUF11/putative Ig domain-containing protein